MFAIIVCFISVLLMQDSRTRDRPLRHLCHDWSIRMFCQPELQFLVGKTSALTNHDKDDVMVCHVL